MVVVRVADDDGLDGGRVGEGVVATRAGWVRFSLLEALDQLWEANLPSAPSPHKAGIGSNNAAKLEHCRARSPANETLLEHGADKRRAGPGRLEAATASVEGKVKLTGWDRHRINKLIQF